MNKEYIDKHEAYLLLKHKAETYMLLATKEAYEKAAILIDSIKPHEVQPVKHGHWIEHPDDIFPLESTIECSVCGEQENVNINNDNFCSNCGCKMDGDKE